MSKMTVSILRADTQEELAALSNENGIVVVPREGDHIAFHGKAVGVVSRVVWNLTSRGLVVNVMVAIG